VLCTAYSDYSLGDIITRFGNTDRLLILKKPFDVVEVNLLAIAMNEKWHLARQASTLIRAQSEQLADAKRVCKIIETCHEELELAHLDLKNQAWELSERLQQRTSEIFGTRDAAVFGLAQLAESRDPETGEHLRRIQRYSRILAEHLARQGPYTDHIDDRFLEDIFRSSALHDIGKVGIPDTILLKPGRLTPAEFEVMKRHSVIGAESLARTTDYTEHARFLSMAVVIARHHHEWFDGAGYPDGLAGTDIPLPARIVAVADVFDALTSKRVYKDAMSLEEAKSVIENEEGTHFDPAVVDAFRATFDEFVQTKLEIDGQAEESGELVGAGASAMS